MKKPSHSLFTSSCAMLAKILATLVSAVAVAVLSAAPAAATNYPCSWNASTANWSTGGDWSGCNGTYPNNGGGNTYDATIATAGTYTVTLSSPVTIGTLTLNNGNATLSNSSTLATTGGVNLQAGTLSGGTYAVTGGGTAAVGLTGSSNYGTLNGVTLNGSLNLTGNSTTAYFNGLTVKDVTGALPGVINVTGSSAYLYSTATQTLDNATVHLGGASGPGYLYSASGTLTLGSNLHVLADGGASSYGQLYGGPIVNNGSIAFSNGSANNYINPSTFTNTGAITVATGTTLYVQPGILANSGTGTITGADGSNITLGPGGTFTNAGTVAMNGTGGTTTLQIGYAGNPGNNPAFEWTNTGTINVTNTDLRLGGYFTNADIGTINRTSGSVELYGHLENTASTLNVQTGALAGMTMAGGTIKGGTIQGGSSNLFINSSANGTLNGVQVNGSLDLTGNSSIAYFKNGLTVKDSTGTNPGVINVTGSSAQLYSTTTQTLDNATVHLGGASGPGYLGSNSGTLTLGSNLHVLADGSASSYGYITGGPIVNNGSMAFSNGSANNYINPSSFINNGAITVATGTTLYAQPSAQTNSATGTITGADGSYITLSGNGGTFTNAGTVTMNGAGGATILGIGIQGNVGNNPAYEWTNTGTINVTNTDLRLGGYFTNADIGTINRTGGSVELYGYLNNSSSTLNLATGALAGMTMAGGTIHGGTIQGGSSNLFTVNSSQGTLDGVQINGSLDVTGNSSVAYFSNGLTVKDSTGTNPGVINVTGSSAQLYSTTTQTLDNATVHLGGASGPGYLGSNSGTLTLGSNLHVLADGSASSYGYISGTAIVNDGSLAFSNGSASNYINPSTFTNNGAITVATGTGLTNYYNLTNSGTGTITGADGSSIALGQYGTVTNAGTVTMNGTGGATKLQIGYQGNVGANTAYEWTNTGTINVTQTDLRLGGYFTQSDLGTINRTGGTVSLLGYLENSASTLNIQTGALAGMTMAGGTIHGGTIQGGSSNLFTNTSATGTLDGVQINGSLDVTGNYTAAYFSNGLTVKDVTGTLPGVINVTGSSAQLYSTGTQTLDNATVHLGGASGPGYLYSASGTLTLGSNLQVLADGSASSYGQLYGGSIVNNGSLAFSNGSASNYINPSTFTNNGAITVATGTTLYIQPSTLANSGTGTITGADGSSIALGQYGTVTNAGTVTMNGTGGATKLQIGYQGNVGANTAYEWTNTGTINVTQTDLRLGGYFTQSDIGTINRPGGTGTVSLNGYLENSAAILNIQTGALAGMAMAGGTIHGGTIQGGSSNLFTNTSATGTLDGVQINGSLDVTGNSAQAYFSNGLTVKDTAGTLPGVINVTGSSAYLYSMGTQTLDNATVHLGGVSGPGYLYSGSGTLTLGSNLQVLADGSPSSYGYLYGDTIVNNGSLAFSNGSASNYIYPSTFTNNGIVSVSNGSVVYMYPTNFTNFSSGTLSGGSYQAYAGSVLNLPYNTFLTTLAADTVLSGTGSKIQTYKTSDGTTHQLEEMLTTISGSGALHVLANRDYTTTNAINNQGLVELGGGTFTAPSYANSGTTRGFGTVNPLINNTGLVEISGGTLKPLAGIQGTGNIQVDNGATLDLSGVAYTASNYTNAGTTFGSGTVTPVIVNTGLVQASGGTLTATGGITGNTGSVKIDPSGTLVLGAASSTGTLIHNGTASGSLNLGANNITVFNDYQNANFGTGNSFNNRANVTGTGHILAAGATPGAAQTLSGNIVGGTTSGNGVMNFGNVHVGSSVTQNYQIGNANSGGPDLRGAIQTTVNGGNLTDGRLSGSGVTAGNYGPITSGGNSGNLAVTFNATSAGALSGQQVHVLNNFDNTNAQNLSITGVAYRLASANILGPISFGNVHVGDTVQQALNISNTAANDSFSEKLNASFGASSDVRITTSGSISQLAAGSSNSSSMIVGLNTSAAGTVSGTQVVNFASDGTGTSGLGITALASQTIGVSGDITTSGSVFRLASASPATPNPVNFGNVRLGSATDQALSITNTAANDGFSEKLNASLGGASGGVTATGAFTLLAAQSTDSSSLHVGIDTSSAGAKSGSATISLNSDGTGTSGLGITALPSQTVNVNGNVYRLAQGNTTPTPINFGNMRVGGVASQVLTVANTAASDGYSESLNAAFGGVTGNATQNGGSVSLLAAGANNSAAMGVGLDTSSAGSKSGSVTLNYQSDGAGTSGLAAISAGNQTINVSGAVYRLAQGDTSPLTVNFGNVHVGPGPTQTLTIQNLAANDGYSEQLNTSFGTTTGAATNNGGLVGLLAAGGSNNANMAVGLNTSSAGAKSGSVTLNYVSDGSGTSGLAAIGAGNQTITVSGNVYRLASANTLGAISFGNVHVGDTVQQALNINNTAANDAFSEKLNASFGASSDVRITTSGSISQLAAGSSNSSSMIVGLNTSAAGTVSGTQVVNFASDGTGTSGLGITALASQTIGVSGDITTSGSVFRLASASPATPNPVNFGNVRIGSATDQALSITNTAANDGFSEKLNASLGGASGGVTATGAFTLLAAQSTDNSSLHVGIDTSSAGAKSGSATIALQSDGTGTSGLGTTNLAAQTVNVSGNVYRMASPTLNTPAVTLVARVGDAAPSANVSVTNSSPDVYTEGLKAGIGATAAPFTSSGSIANLAAQGTDTSSLKVGLNTATAGASAGTATVNFTSTGAGTTNAADVSVGSSIVNLVGKVYQQAVAQVNTLAVNFGIVHVGDSVSPQAVSVTNAAPVAGLNDVLQGSLAAASGAFSTSGSLGTGVAAGATDNNSLKVGLNTSTAGMFTSITTANLVSHNADLADLALSAAAVNLSAQVNNYAVADITKTGGTGGLSQSGNVFTLNFGQVQQGIGSLSAFLAILNNVSGPADLLSGSFDLTGANDYGFSGFNPFANLAAGDSQGGFNISFDTGVLGNFSDTILLSAIGSNDSGYSGSLAPITLQIEGDVITGTTVPEPGTLFLLSLGLVGILLLRRRSQPL